MYVCVCVCVQGVDGPTLRLDPLGKDMEGSKYWHFYGTRLYKEATAAAKKREKNQNNINNGKKKDASGASTPKSMGSAGRGGSAKRGRPATAGCGRGGRNASREGTPATAVTSGGIKGRGKQMAALKTTSSSTPVGRRSARKSKKKNLLVMENGMGAEEEEEDVIHKIRDIKTTEGDLRVDEEEEVGGVVDNKKNGGEDRELDL